MARSTSENNLLGLDKMDATIRFTRSMLVSPAKDSVFLSPDNLSRALASNLKYACEILPKDTDTKVRMYYDLDGATQCGSSDEFSAITDYLDTQIQSFKLDGVSPVVYTSHKYGYVKKGETINKLSYRLYFPSLLFTMNAMKETLGSFKNVLSAHFGESLQIVYDGDAITNETYLTLDPSVYSPERKMRLPLQSKDGETRPLLPIGMSLDDAKLNPQHLLNALITYNDGTSTDYNGTTLKVAPKNTLKVVPKPVQFEVESEVDEGEMDEVEKLCELLDERFVSSYDNWIRLLFCLKSLGEKYKSTFLKVSRKCPKYNKPATQRENAEKWDATQISNCRITKGSLRHWAKRCNPKAYFEMKKKTYDTLLQTIPLTSNELCEIFSVDMAGDIMYSESNKEFYIFNQNNGLWENKLIHSTFTSRIQSIVQQLIGSLPPAKDEKEIELNNALTKKYLSAMGLCDGYKLNNLISKYLPAFCSTENNEDPVYFLNSLDTFLNLKNGVWDFKRRQLIPYDRSHYFTFKLDVEYKPDADTTDIHNAFSLWFKGDKDVMSFVRYWLGYCLTGYTDRQELLFVWGESAGNGKSTLFNELMGGLLGSQKLMEILTSTDIRNRGDNNEGLYRLNGKRFAIISEPSKNTKGEVEFDNDLMKNISGDREISAQAKYKNKITFRNTSKVAFIFNELPEINFEDKGMFRRMVILEMNVSFKTPEDYEKCASHLKDTGLVQKRDSEFIRRVLSNKEGFLKYLLEGADEFMTELENNCLRSIPASMKSVKEKAVSELDTLGGWLDSWLEYEEGGKIRKSDLLSRWRYEKVDFGQGVKGFVNRLKTKCESRGYGWDAGAKGKGREVILNAKLRDETEPEEV